jgi:5'-nucleotidase / UDP-sugar diphosphatase
MTNKIRKLIVLLVILSMAIPFTAPVNTVAAPPTNVTFTILHTNDFHGQLEEVYATPATSSNPGMARVATIVNNVRTEVGSANVLLVDAGDEMQGSLLSNIKQGVPTIDVFNTMKYVAATFGNHEFDWGQTVLSDRTTQATYPYVTANIVKKGTAADCAAAGWEKPDFADAPYTVLTVGTAPNTVKVAFIGVTTTETPIITIASATTGLCFKDPADSILHYYDQMKADGADVIVVLSHLGYGDGGYGYGIPIYGDQTLATKLNTAGKPVNLIIGGHSHTNLASATTVGTTKVVQAHYNGRKVGRADITVTSTGTVSVNWTRLTVFAGNTPLPDVPTPEDPTIKTLISSYTSDPAYQALINQEIGWTNVPIIRNYDGDSLMGYFVNDAIYSQVNTDAVAENDVDMVFNNPGGLRADISCAAYPCKLTYGMMFNILPFGNATAIGTMTGEQIMELLNQSASLSKGAIQPAGLRFSFYNYRVDTDPTPAVSWKAWSWGAFDACVINKTSKACEPLDLKKTYKVATNEFLAPAGQDNFYAFKYMQNISYWGDMLNQVNAWVSANYTTSTPYSGALDGRITRVGDDTSGPIIPLTILHHNDSHGNLAKGAYVGYTQLATLIKQERAYNPSRTLLLSGGDNIQGDSMMYYFKSSYSGFASDGTPLPASLQPHPLIAAFNAMSYDAMDLGNHEFNFGSDVFKGIMGQAQFPILGANVADTGAYGLATANGGQGVKPYILKDLGGIKVAVLGITNHRVPNYELPSNIVGLTFSDPLAKAQELSTQLRASNDVVIALTHIGFTEDPKSVEVDKNVDTNMAMTVSGLDAIIGSHSHTNPATGFGAYKYLPTYVLDPNNVPVIINQAYRYNNTLGEIFIGLRLKAGGGYEVVSRAGQYISVGTSVVEDPAIKAIVDPYVTQLNVYNNTPAGKTAAPIDTTNAYIAETNAANLQADASVWELGSHGITDVDFHLSGAMTRPSDPKNWIMFPTATPAVPVQMKVSDMFTLMPYENSLVTLRMNGPQLKAVLERAYRNYYYYKYVPGYGGYSYYTTCMIDTNSVGKITYNDLYPAAYDPAKSYVVSLEFVDKLGKLNEVNFDDASTYYKVSTVNYLAAGSCNFNDGGVSLWPLNQIVNDTQYYVRDAVIDYATAMGTILPVVEGRLQFIKDVNAPTITITSPEAINYLHWVQLPINFSAVDVGPAGLKDVWADLDGVAVTSGQLIDLFDLSLGDHTLTVYAMDKAYNKSSQSVTFTVIATVASMQSSLNRLYKEGQIDNAGIYKGLSQKLNAAQMLLNKGQKAAAINILEAFIKEVTAQSGNHIDEDAADMLIADAQWVIAHLPR